MAIHPICVITVYVNMDSILIALIGDTGAGKATFISQAMGRNDLPIGRGIDSCKSAMAGSDPLLTSLSLYDALHRY